MRDEVGVTKIVDRSTFQSELDGLRVREKAHTHEGDAIAAARRRLPMVEIDPAIRLIGAQGGRNAPRRVRGPPTVDCLLLHAVAPASLHRSSEKGAPRLHRKSASCPIFILATSPSRRFAKALTKRVPGIVTSWDGKCLGSRPRTRLAHYWLRRKERAGCIWCAT
jgi:hypothetical protein